MEKARRFSAARLFLVFIFGMISLFLLFQLIHFALAQRNPSLQLTPSPISTALPIADTEGKLDINTANADELDTLPGIGPALAKAIIDFRAENHGFYFIEELMDVPGIGEKKFNDMRAFIFCSALESP